MPKIPLWGWILIAVAAVLLLKPKASVGVGQGRQARPGGSLSQASMGTVLSKNKGEVVRVAFSFTASTKSAAGTLIPWTYKLRVGLYDLVDGANIDIVSPPPFTSAPGTFPVDVGLFTTNAIVGHAYEAVVELSVAASNPDGTPNLSDMIVVDTKDSRPDVVLIRDPATPAIPAGTIVPPITLSQMEAARRFLQ